MNHDTGVVISGLELAALPTDQSHKSRSLPHRGVFLPPIAQRQVQKPWWRPHDERPFWCQERLWGVHLWERRAAVEQCSE